MSKFCEIISSESIMNKMRLLCLVMAICFTNGAKAQFYDRADEIYFYAAYEDGGFVEKPAVIVFNFDGRKAAILNWNESGLSWTGIEDIKSKMKISTNYFEQQVETTDYDLKYVSYNKYSVSKRYVGVCQNANPVFGSSEVIDERNIIFEFSSSRDYCDVVEEGTTIFPNWPPHLNRSFTYKYKYKRVDKSFFKVGRSRTPSGTLHE